MSRTGTTSYREVFPAFGQALGLTEANPAKTCLARGLAGAVLADARVARHRSSVTARFRTGVSLHSHTSYSRESLEFIPQYARKSATLARVLNFADWQYQSRTGQKLDFSKGFWTPPLAAAAALRLESSQIEEKLGLRALVSLTDHDNLEAGLETNTPVSLEWSVPYGPTFLHLGVHNLPRQKARGIAAELYAFTRQPKRKNIPGLLAMLNSDPDTLVVLNHPLWDEGLIGQIEHEATVREFFGEFGGWLHALELNGLRSVEENGNVCAFAASMGAPVISGGDRHGREPNANVNLTNAETFSEFVSEIREEKRSEIVFMPQYFEPLRLRRFETAWDIIQTDPDRMDGCSRWSDRVFYERHRGNPQALSEFFGGKGPAVLLPFLILMRVLEIPQLRPALRLALAD